MKDVIEAMGEAMKNRVPAHIDDLIRAALSAALERGWKLAPVALLDAVKQLESRIQGDARNSLWGDMAKICAEYRAMIAASPEVR